MKILINKGAVEIYKTGGGASSVVPTNIHVTPRDFEIEVVLSDAERTWLETIARAFGRAIGEGRGSCQR